MAETPTVAKARMRQVAARLERAHGAPPAPPRLPPLDELILTVLSQHTSDVNRDRAFDDLKRAFPSWEDVADAPAPLIARAIRRGGLAPTKAVRIKALLGELRAQGRPLDRGAFKGMRAPALYDLLVALPGVGPKTAACVLLFSLGKPYFPVDTHVHRIALRLGLVPPGTDAVRTQFAMQEAIAPSDMYAVHMNLIRHGRAVCDARRPKCEECVLATLCPRVGVKTRGSLPELPTVGSSSAPAGSAASPAAGSVLPTAGERVAREYGRAERSSDTGTQSAEERARAARALADPAGRASRKRRRGARPRAGA